MEIKIAICDDVKGIGVEVENMITSILEERMITAKIEVYTSSQALKDRLEIEKYDLIFLDIEMPQPDGLVLGKYIREILDDNITQIVYITSNQTHSLEVHEIRPMNFLVKPLKLEKMVGIIDTYIRIMGAKSNVLKIVVDRETQTIDVAHIEYMQSDRRKISIKTKGKYIEFYGKLEDMYQKVKGFGFWYIHKSIIVNPNCVRKFEYSQMIMTDGEVLPISQAKRVEVSKMVKEYVRR